ncbi:MAG TPA: hypothetical protein PLB21_00340, partial [Actinomycetota bacterium]|nr:hypothetical protein [Actinomycetota bacterium]
MRTVSRVRAVQIAAVTLAVILVGSTVAYLGSGRPSEASLPEPGETRDPAVVIASEPDDARQIGGATGQDVIANFLAARKGPENPTVLADSLWWAWLSPATGSTRFSTVGSEIDTAIMVRRGSATGPLVASATRAGDLEAAEIVFETVAGETYYLAVSSEEKDPRPGLVTLTWQPVLAAGAGSATTPPAATAAPAGTASADPSSSSTAASSSAPSIAPAATVTPTTGSGGVQAAVQAASVPEAQVTASFSAAEIPLMGTTGEKPQSKVWRAHGSWWTVLASAAPAEPGTWVWRYGTGGWTAVIRVSDRTDVRADVHSAGDVAHVLLHGPQTSLVSLEYDEASESYVPWSQRATATVVSLPGSETATIDIDGNGRMWLATETASAIQVRWADAPFSTFSAAITIASGIDGDDIGVITKLPGRMGILWSNQQTRRFGFRTHVDGASPSSWSTVENVPASSLNLGDGVADDHVNVAVSSAGKLYAAVKTSYNSTGATVIALLVRNANGNWDPLREVDTKGTRPIVLIDESTGTLRMLYTASEQLDNILTKVTLLDDPDFSGDAEVALSGAYNNVTSTKANVGGEALVLAGGA